MFYFACNVCYCIFKLIKQVLVDAQQQYNRKDHFSPNLGQFYFEVSALLHIVSSFILVQYTTTNDPILENSKNPNFEYFLQFLPLLVRNCPKLSFYAIMQLKGKLLNQTWENSKKKLILDPILDCMTQIYPSPTKKNFSWVLPLLDVTSTMKFQEKLMNQAWENGNPTLACFDKEEEEG